MSNILKLSGGLIINEKYPHLEQYFSTKIGNNCTEYCYVMNDGTMIGSCKCSECDNCVSYGVDDDENVSWIKCKRLNYAKKG